MFIYSEPIVPPADNFSVSVNSLAVVRKPLIFLRSARLVGFVAFSVIILLIKLPIYARTLTNLTNPSSPVDFTWLTRSHEMSLNLKIGNLRYLHVSNLQVLLVILLLKSHLYSNKCGCDVLLKVACVAEAILGKSALKSGCALSSFSFNP